MWDMILGLLSASGVGGAVAFVVSSIFKARYDRKLETHKAELKHEYDLAAERLKGEIRVSVAERQVKFGRFYDEMATTITELYARLSELTDAVAAYIDPAQPHDRESMDERSKELCNVNAEFIRYFRRRRIFLPNKTSKHIDKLITKLHVISVEFSIFVHRAADSREKTRQWMATIEHLRDEAMPILNHLQKDLAKLIGADCLNE